MAHHTPLRALPLRALRRLESLPASAVAVLPPYKIPRPSSAGHASSVSDPYQGSGLTVALGCHGSSAEQLAASLGALAQYNASNAKKHAKATPAVVLAPEGWQAALVTDQHARQVPDPQRQLTTIIASQHFAAGAAAGQQLLAASRFEACSSKLPGAAAPGYASHMARLWAGNGTAPSPGQHSSTGAADGACLQPRLKYLALLQAVNPYKSSAWLWVLNEESVKYMLSVAKAVHLFSKGEHTIVFVHVDVAGSKQPAASEPAAVYVPAPAINKMTAQSDNDVLLSSDPKLMSAAGVGVARVNLCVQPGSLALAVC